MPQYKFHICITMCSMREMCGWNLVCLSVGLSDTFRLFFVCAVAWSAWTGKSLLIHICGAVLTKVANEAWDSRTYEHVALRKVYCCPAGAILPLVCQNSSCFRWTIWNTQLHELTNPTCPLITASLILFGLAWKLNIYRYITSCLITETVPVHVH